MVKTNITGHMLVKNEDIFVWYAISSVLPYVDKLLIFDTGSIDGTDKIIQSFKDEKIEFRQFNIKKREEIADLRNKQIKLTKTSWIWIVDGDEIYPKDLCSEIATIVADRGEKLDGIVVRRYDLLGDIYHYQSETVGGYNLFGRRGHLVLRLINKKNIPGLHLRGIYPYEGYYDKDGVEIIKHDKWKFAFTKRKLLHAMYLKRSSLGGSLSDTFHRHKYKIEWGNKFPEGFKYPEVFYLKRPSFVSDVTCPRSNFYNILAAIIIPIKLLKRKLF